MAIEAFIQLCLNSNSIFMYAPQCLNIDLPIIECLLNLAYK